MVDEQAGEATVYRRRLVPQDEIPHNPVPPGPNFEKLAEEKKVEAVAKLRTAELSRKLRAMTQPTHTRLETVAFRRSHDGREYPIRPWGTPRRGITHGTTFELHDDEASRLDPNVYHVTMQYRKILPRHGVLGRFRPKKEDLQVQLRQTTIEMRRNQESMGILSLESGGPDMDMIIFDSEYDIYWLSGGHSLQPGQNSFAKRVTNWLGYRTIYGVGGGLIDLAEGRTTIFTLDLSVPSITADTKEVEEWTGQRRFSHQQTKTLTAQGLYTADGQQAKLDSVDSFFTDLVAGLLSYVPEIE